MDMIRKYTRIDSLTSLRFFAALGVFLHHMGIFNSVENESIKNMAKYFFNDYVGVTFFYILSGFIINYNYNNHLAGKRFDIKDFLVFRFGKIVPVHLLTLIVFVFLFNKFSELPG
ncbi:acyltransferase family protein [Cedecea davisae]|uniref:acyltransferase family protein n=1 Tax=Cedecea davisae TaxID=158484 RepID=UPI00376F2150